MNDVNYSLCFLTLSLYFSASGQAVVTGVVPSPPGLLLSMLLSRIRRVQQSQLLVDFSSSVANSRSRFFRKSIYAQDVSTSHTYMVRPVQHSSSVR